MKPSGPGLLFVGRFLIAASISVFVIGPFIFSISPYVSDSKESACNVGDLGSISGSGRSPEDGNGNPLKYSCQNSMVRVAWPDTVHGVTPHTHTHTHTHHIHQFYLNIS